MHISDLPDDISKENKYSSPFKKYNQLHNHGLNSEIPDTNYYQSSTEEKEINVLKGNMNKQRVSYNIKSKKFVRNPKFSTKPNMEKFEGVKSSYNIGGM